MSLYQLPRKAETGLGLDRLLQEFMPAKIRISVVEAGRGYRTCPAVVHKKQTNLHFIQIQSYVNVRD
jgi:hypothetical protein